MPISEIIKIIRQYGAVISIALTVVAVILVATLFIAQFRKDWIDNES